jgi:heavy metal sensor kinase
MFRTWRLNGRVTSGLRFRLTLTYVLFFTLLLGFVGIFFRQTLRSLYDTQMHNVLTEEWAAVRGYLRIEKPKGSKSKQPEVIWYYDRADPEEALIVDRLKQVYVLMDESGHPIRNEIGPKYVGLPWDTPDEIRRALRTKEPVWKVKFNKDGEKYLMRSGVLMSDDEKPYYVEIGRSYAEGDRILRDFTRYYFALLPLVIASACVLGWFMAGRALVPVNDLAETAQRITGSNLTVQIPPRGAGDELDRLIEAFNRMIERLDASLRQARQFSTDVSHELRTPLTAIRGQLEVALLAAKTPEQYQEAILNALQDVERLSQTIRALLLLSQAESGQLALQRQTLDLSDITRDIVDQFQIPAESSRLTLSAQVPEHSHIEADRVQIERLLSNLLSNAVKYTPEGGAITVTLEDHPGEVVLRVADTGVGISRDHLPHIFDRFYRVPNADGTQEKSPERGLGLGLSFVASIARAHRGTINVKSTPGQGTTFEVRLPRGTVRIHEPHPAEHEVTHETEARR